MDDSSVLDAFAKLRESTVSFVVSVGPSVRLSDSSAVYEAVCKNRVQPDRLRMTISYGACAVHAAYLRLQTHTQNM